MSDIKKLAGQTAIYGAPTIIGRLLNYFLVPLYTYSMATHNYGVVSELYAYIAFLMVILTYGMETAFFRYVQTEQDKSRVYNTSLLSMFASTTLFLIISFSCLSSIAANMGYGDNREYIGLFLLILALDALRAIPYALIRDRQQAKRFAFIKSADIFSNIFFNLFFLLLCPWLMKTNLSGCVAWFFNPNDLVFYIFLANMFASGIAFLLLMPEFLQFRVNFDFKLWGKMLLYGFPVMIGGLAGMINETFDRIALKHLITVPDTIVAAAEINAYKMSQLGIYGACYKLSILITLFIQAFKFAAEPFFFSKMNNKDAKETYANVMTVFVISLCVIFLGVMAYIDVFKYFIGSDYRVGIKVVPILLAGNLCLGIYYNLSIWYKITDRTKYGAYIALIGAAVTLVLNYLLVPVYGYMGAAWTTCICYLTIMIVCYLFGQKFYPVDYKVARLAAYILGAIGLYGVMAILPFSSVVLKMGINTSLLFVFIAVACKLDIKDLIRPKNSPV
jgi:O-antigen/teichoic acid export membrane protein